VERRSSAASSQLGRRAFADSSLERRDNTASEEKAEKEFKTIVLPVWLGLSAAVCTGLGVGIGVARHKGYRIPGFGTRGDRYADNQHRPGRDSERNVRNPDEISLPDEPLPRYQPEPPKHETLSRQATQGSTRKSGTASRRSSIAR